MNVMVCFMCGLNLIEDVLTVCCLYCLCLESWDVISGLVSRDTIVSICCQREW